MPSRLSIALALLLSAVLLLLPTPTQASCTMGYDSKCNSTTFTATSSVFFHVNSTASNKNYETYNVTVIFHWDNNENITVGPTPYKIGEPMGLSNEFTYINEGYYNVGTTLIFEDGAAAGCSGKTYDRSTLILMERTPSRCVFGATSPNPTAGPSVSMVPTVSSVPTSAPVAGGNDNGNDNGGAGVVGGRMDVFRLGLFSVGLVAALGVF